MLKELVGVVSSRTVDGVSRGDDVSETEDPSETEDTAAVDTISAPEDAMLASVEVGEFVEASVLETTPLDGAAGSVTDATLGPSEAVLDKSEGDSVLGNVALLDPASEDALTGRIVEGSAGSVVGSADKVDSGEELVSVESTTEEELS